ncbi:Calcium-transporting ATPase [Forsythia ovata]|uniref:Calcium-transporting ATPase n=1 Tax=Forsythia ovata TaxID=205694 RepID=A0ABD1WFU2_9LAMI
MSTQCEDSCEDCQYAGVNVKMTTGDNVFTTTAIATECRILKLNEEMDDGSVVEGVTFRNYTEEERMEKVDKICVMARSSPLDKLLMVQCLKKKGHVVAVTGDGTNDAPALKEADIGISMGIQGTEVTKENITGCSPQQLLPMTQRFEQFAWREHPLPTWDTVIQAFPTLGLSYPAPPNLGLDHPVLSQLENRLPSPS